MNATLEQNSQESFRDELNFAEFPLASVSTSLPKGQKTLEFTDEIFDKARNQRITRKLTITASDKYGLPTAMDDEVILGLIQLTGRSGFVDRRVFFTRYELLKLLNWSDDTRNYKRLEQSLNRWLGVTLYYDKSWWSKEEQCWVNEGFHILDHVQVMDKERQRRASKREGEQIGKSSFVWNEAVFNSFKAGYMKQIDFEFYKGLESAVSKRMYRFLDKRFYHRSKLEFDLRTFACEHIGLSKNYHNGELKRVLTPAILELEKRGFLKPVSTEERFVRGGKAQWSVVFLKNSKVISQQPSNLVEELIQRGINPRSAQALVRSTSEEKIREKLTFFDWLKAKEDLRVQRSPAGFLYRAISEDFSPPADYLAGIARTQQQRPKRAVPASTPEEEKPSPKAIAERKRFQKHWESLPVEEQERVERELVLAAPLFIREQYIASRKERGLLFQTIRQGLIENYVRDVLKAA